MALTSTQLVLAAAPLPPAWRGSPQELIELFLQRARILAPFGVSTFVISSQLPASNQGPLLLGGTKWYVWSDAEAKYVPLDISDSLTQQFAIQTTEPTEPEILFWAQTDTSTGDVVNFWIRSLGTFRALLPLSGPSTSRPSAPFNLQQYFDTTINALIHWERGKWRTLSGSVGDVKFVTHLTLAAALLHNPGWVEVGSSSLGVAARGRTFTPAHTDAGGSPANSFTAEAGITARVAGVTFGEETHVLTSAESPVGTDHSHGIGAFTGAAPGDDIFLRLGAWTVAADYSRRNVSGNSSSSVITETAGTSYAATEGIVSGPVLSPPTPTAHNNIQPAMALYCLVKE